jgi:hypothetical protein
MPTECRLRCQCSTWQLAAAGVLEQAAPCLAGPTARAAVVARGQPCTAATLDAAAVGMEAARLRLFSTLVDAALAASCGQAVEPGHGTACCGSKRCLGGGTGPPHSSQAACDGPITQPALGTAASGSAGRNMGAAGPPSASAYRKLQHACCAAWHCAAHHQQKL